MLTLRTLLTLLPSLALSPEDAWGRPRLCPAADVWSLCATLCEMVGGSPPFSGGSFEQLVANVLALRYELPLSIGDEVSV